MPLDVLAQVRHRLRVSERSRNVFGTLHSVPTPTFVQTWSYGAKLWAQTFLMIVVMNA